LNQTQFIKPLYDSRSFADIPGTIFHLLTGQGQIAFTPEVLGRFARHYDAVILFYIDAFGWHSYEQCKTHLLFNHLLAGGQVARLTSQFPSTTAAHATTIHTGLPVGQSGIYEWYYYEPKVDAIIAPLLFSFSGTRERETLASHINPNAIYPDVTLYKQLAEHHIQSHVIQYSDYVSSPYTRTVTDGAQIHPYQTVTEALLTLSDLLTKQSQPSYYFIYFDMLDLIAHRHGPYSLYYMAEAETLFSSIHKHFLNQQGRLKNTLLMFTSDHGQTTMNPTSTIYLNTDPRFEGIDNYIKRNRSGTRLVPGGSARDFFLYIKDELLDEAQGFLSNRMDGVADVVKTSDLIAGNYFGRAPLSPALLSRLGNLVILPYVGESVWWYEAGKYEQRYFGGHGGLTPQEMEIPLLLYDFSH
jgi:predicted AlkP superfamily pyrophosphatase or phosphodiesterase